MNKPLNSTKHKNDSLGLTQLKMWSKWASVLPIGCFLVKQPHKEVLEDYVHLNSSLFRKTPVWKHVQLLFRDQQNSYIEKPQSCCFKVSTWTTAVARTFHSLHAVVTYKVYCFYTTYIVKLAHIFYRIPTNSNISLIFTVTDL